MGNKIEKSNVDDDDDAAAVDEKLVFLPRFLCTNAVPTATVVIVISSFVARLPW